MASKNYFTLPLLVALVLSTSCRSQIKVKEEDKILHAGPVNSGFGGIFFALYKDNKYEFCDGGFMDPGCYTGIYSLQGDTIVLHDLKEHHGIPSNRFIIRRYKEMDSLYWQWKYPDHRNDWESFRQSDVARGATGDIFPLTPTGEIYFDKNNYFLIRLDKLNGGSNATP